MSFEDLVTFITDNSRAAIAVMLVLTVVATAGVPMVERSTSLDQFQSDTVESDALDYADANFTSGGGNTTTVQIIVRDDDVLAKDSLLAMLDYEQSLRANETINETLVENGSVKSVARAVGTLGVREDRADALRQRGDEINETREDLRHALDVLASDRNASVRGEFDAVAANSSVNLSDDYGTFEAAAYQLRNATAGTASGRNVTASDAPSRNATAANATAGNATSRNATARNATAGNATAGANQTAIEAAYRKGTKGVLAEEYDALEADKAELEDGIETTPAERLEQVESMNESEIDATVERLLSEDGPKNGRALAFMPSDYDPGSTDSDATMMLVTQETEESSFAAGDAPDYIVDSQQAMQALAEDVDDVSALVFGSGIIADEINDSMVDSILLVGPLALLFVLVVLVFAYRDPLDILLGVVGILGVLLWTFGVMGWVGIAFNQPFIVVIVLLIGLSIDYAIHVVMRYREARSDDEPPRAAMQVALASVGVALVYVTVTTAIGFLSNLSSPLSIFRKIGVVSAIGIISTLLVFGVLIPAVKIELDSLLDSYGVGRSQYAMGSNGGSISRVLSVGATLAERTPALVIVVALLVSAGGVYGATQVDTSFSDEDFLAENPSDWMYDLPEPFAPGEYHAKEGMTVLDDRFVRQDTEAQILVRGDVTDPETLDRLDEAQTNASDMSVTQTYSDGDAAITSPLTLIDRVASSNETFNATLAAADTDGDGVPDENVTAVYDELYRAAPDDAGGVVYRTDDGEYEALRMVVSVSGEASGDTVTDQMRWVADDVEGEDVSAIATGQVVIDAITADQLLETVLWSLVVALSAAFVFLSLTYRFVEGSASLGAVTVVPVAFTVTWILGAMALLDIPFNIVTGLITGLTIGLGVDYSIHVSERFNQELALNDTIGEALHESVTGTGGALLSSATTTASGFAVLVAALLPFLQSFGIITALTIVFAFVASVFVLPSLLAVWARFSGLGEAADDDRDADGSDDGRPGAGAPTDGRTATERPATERPATERPATERPATDRSNADDRSTGRPSTDRPNAGSPGAPASVADADRGGHRRDVGHETGDPPVGATAAGATPAGERSAAPESVRSRDAVPVTPEGVTATRRFSDDYAIPGEATTVTVTVEDAAGRIYLREEPPEGVEDVVDVTPEPLRVVERDATLYVLWNVEDATVTPSITYAAELPADATDGDTFDFDGIVAADGVERWVGGADAVTAVPDVFQRVLARGAVTDDDVRTVADRMDDDEITEEKFDRLCRAWHTGDRR